jgi:DNA topoisomerase-1
LRRKHVRVKGDVVEFDFPGKSGVRQQQQLRDRKVARVIRSTLKVPGFNVFKFENGDGKFVPVTSRHINEYLKEVMGSSFSAKDFRTWAGTLVCACALAREAGDTSLKPTERKRRIVAAIKETAETLGNTPAVCRSSYVCPEIINAFEKGRVIDKCFTSLDDLVSFRGRGLHDAERALIRFLNRP